MPSARARRLILAVIVAVLSAVSVAVATLGTGKGAFHVQCSYSHSNNDDAIVFPGQPGKSHLHDYFGNRSTNASSDRVSLLENATAYGDSSCPRDDEVKTKLPPADGSAYWVPALYDGLFHVPAYTATAYYTTGQRDPSQIRPFPDGTKLIAGTSTGAPPDRTYRWFCGPGGEVASGDRYTAPLCNDPDLRVDLHFPDCWNGRDLDSPDHKSHFTYSYQRQPDSPERVCPSTHPVMVPMLKLALRFATNGGPTVRLSSGAIDTWHGDFLEAWKPGKQAQLVADCLNPDVYCGGTSSPMPGH
jgi:Domain of unknown function (DUF1996)